MKQKLTFLLVSFIVLGLYISCDSVSNIPKADTLAPTAGNSGTITTAAITAEGLTLNWTAASDSITAQEKLEFLVYYSPGNNISTVADMEANGTPIGLYKANITSLGVTGLTASTTYYFNVIVRDEAGNRAAYSTVTQATTATPDVTSPVLGTSWTLTTSGVSSTGMTVNWTVGSDDITSTDSLEYLVYYSTTNNISTVADMIANGKPVGSYTANIASRSISGLTASTTYYFNVIVRDAAGNEAAYTAGSQATTAIPDVTSPTVGNSGTLSTSGVSSSGLTVNWTGGSDDITSTDSLEYLVYYSTTNNISTVVDMESHGTAVESYTANITSRSISGLTDFTTYYFNVIVRDAAGNKSAYTSNSQDTSEGTPPTAGNSGTLTISGVSSSGVTVNWTVGSDNVTSAANLEYLVYYSKSDNISTVAAMETYGTAVESYTANITSRSISGLKSHTKYYFNVIVRDAAGNKSAYIVNLQRTGEGTPPTPENSGYLKSSQITSGLEVNWTKGRDNITGISDLEYLVYYSKSDNIDTVAEMEANGTPKGSYTANISTLDVTGLADLTLYYFNVIVRDEAGNKSAYTSNSQRTSDGPPPTPGNSGYLSPTSITSGLKVNWTGGSDDDTSAANLEYLVYYSESDNIDSVWEMETNGTAAGSYTANIATLDVTGLTVFTKYYFNVIIRDEAGNKSAYNVCSATTKDSTLPTPGNSGTLTISDVTKNILTVNWTRGTDNGTSVEDLKYRAYYSKYDNISTVDDVEANGTSLSYSYNKDDASQSKSGLTENDTYYFNVIIRDEAGNKAVYTSTCFKLSDSVPPTPGNSGILTFSDVTSSDIRVNWTEGSDDLTSSAELQYILYSSTSDNLNTVADISSNGTMCGAQNECDGISVESLSADTTYYFNVIIRDLWNNMTAYTSNSVKTAP